MEYVAFVRGINVGGRRPVKMTGLRSAFEAMGFWDVRTVLASGNVIFETERPVPAGEAAASAVDDGLRDSVALAERVGRGLLETFGPSLSVSVRTIVDIRRLVDSDPFRDLAPTPSTRLYITFLSRPEEGRLDFVYESPNRDLTIRRISPGEVAGTVVLSPGRGTTDLMKLLDKEFGPTVTTRNWDTLVKVAKA